MGFKIGDVDDVDEEITNMKDPYFMKLVNKDPELKALWNDMSNVSISSTDKKPEQK